MTQQTHLVFGTGLIGGHLAGALISQGFETRLFGREKSREAMAGGLKISDYLGNEVELAAPQFLSADEAETTSIDVIWLTVKCTAIESVIPTLRPILSDSTTVICCQNGLGSDRPLREAFPENTFVTAIVGYNVAEPRPGHLHRSTEGKLVIESTELTDGIIEQARSELLPIAGTHNIPGEQWAKLQLNLANPVNALADIPTLEMTQDAGYRKIIATLMAELLAVTRAMELELPQITAVPPAWVPRILRMPNWLFRVVAQKMLAIDPTARVSMWWDLQGGKKTEIDFLNGAVARRGQSLGVDCPANQRITELIHQVEREGNKARFSAGELERLLLGQREE